MGVIQIFVGVIQIFVGVIQIFLGVVVGWWLVLGCLVVVCWVCVGCVLGVCRVLPGVAGCCWVFCCVLLCFVFSVLLLFMFPFFLSTCLALVGVPLWRAPKIDFPQQEKAQNKKSWGPFFFRFWSPPPSPPDRPSVGPPLSRPPLPQTALPRDAPPPDNLRRTTDSPDRSPSLQKTTNFGGVLKARALLQTCTFERSQPSKNHQHSTRRPPEREERVKFPTGDGKKSAKFWAPPPPTLRSPHSRPPPFEPSPFGPPQPSNPHPSNTQFW